MIEAKSLTMHYGTTRALDKVSFKVQENEIVGLLGPNGAGKSTIMRILTTFIYPTQGTALVDGIDVTEDPISARKAIGYLPESPPLYTDMRVDEFIDFIARARGIPSNRMKERKDWVIEACGIGSVWKHQIYELSLGYRQRVGLAQALIHDPRVIILDEPTSGLDPIQIIGIRNLIRGLAKNRTILFSTHILQEASTISNRLLIINGGKIVAQGTPDELKTRKGGDFCVVAVDAGRAELEPALQKITALEGLKFIGESSGSQRYSFTTSAYQEAAVAINRLVKEKNWVLKELSREKTTLEDVFISFFERSVS